VDSRRSEAQGAGDRSEIEAQLFDARKERAFVRSRLGVLRRYRARRAAAGHETEAVDSQIDALIPILADWDTRVESLRDAAGRPSRAHPSR
jgi:hypothetical protein